MKVIDFDTRGNVIRLYFGKDDDNDYWGDDWDDVPYEHNAGIVYSEYVIDIKEYAFPFNYKVMTPESDWNYNRNSPFSKEDMKKRKCPCLIIKKLKDEYDDWVEYSELLGSEEPDVLKIYFNDKLKNLEEKFNNFEAIFFERNK